MESAWILSNIAFGDYPTIVQHVDGSNFNSNSQFILKIQNVLQTFIKTNDYTMIDLLLHFIGNLTAQKCEL